MYSKPSEISKMEFFCQKIDSVQLLTILAEHLMLEVL